MTESTAFLLIGDGRLARHLAAYSRMLGIDMARWARSVKDSPGPQFRGATHILLAISDDGIAEFYERWRTEASETTSWIHFSGASVYADLNGAHPLMTFGSQLYDLPTYSGIPFILDEGSPSLESILPGFPNPSYEIPVDKKALYHAWAVLATNAVAGTWREYRRIAAEEFGLPETALIPFLKKTAENALCLDAPVTGPIVRGDVATIESNLRALDGSAFSPLYKALLTALRKEQD